MLELPFTNFHLEPDNAVEKFFWGRLAVERGTSMFYFQKGELVQEMIHRLKYKNEGFIGKLLGLKFGEILMESDFLKDIDFIVPVPIHKSKRNVRNYNQCALIADGISKITGIPYVENVLIKHNKTASQTNKTREQRIDNLKHTFRVENPEKLAGQHVLLLDDILTTGATLEAAGSLIVDFNCRISIAVLAVGKY
ncbi:amidophosphoribosyltransferase [Portibacter lacus]|uniref:Amidophosphoribosyltransferase n=2 Tax=Portibacter lacus TaxID=1099794 RepID=A0AA37STX9_9BACT|nr:amidophosphoribosyltransferase [Portibacter lacus]